MQILGLSKKACLKLINFLQNTINLKLKNTINYKTKLYIIQICPAKFRSL